MKRSIFHVFPLVLLSSLALIPPRLMAGDVTAQVPVVQALFPSESSEIAIKQWRFLGPFRFEQKEIEASDAEKLPVGLNRDYLTDFGLTEATVDAAAFAAVARPKSGAVLDEQFRNELISATPKTNILDLGIGNNSQNYAIAYLALVIESPADQYIAIASGADDNLKVWLNHEMLVADPLVVHRFIKKFRHLTGARLTKGSNFLLVKVGNLTGDWRFMVTLFPHDPAIRLAEENTINPILVNSIAPIGHPLNLRGDLLPFAEHLELQIADSNHHVVDSTELKPNRQLRKELQKLEKDRLYYCRLSAASQTIEKPFFYGDPDAGFAKLLEQSAAFKGSDESVQIDLAAQFGRLKHLLKPENRASDYWDQKVAASFAEIETNFSALRESTEAFLHLPGTHLRGYRSSVDGQVAYYWLHFPQKAQSPSKPMPLVIVLPWTGLTNLPFLESYQMAAFDETERYRKLGDEYGFGVLQVWGRGSYLGGTAIWRADVFEALAAVQRDYGIDSERIYLLGDCEGGRQALLLAERYPERFAAVAVEGPITISRNYPPVFSRWSQYASPLSAIRNLGSMPILINHEEIDNAPPIQDSENFASQARLAGVDVTLIRREGGFHGFSQDPTGVKRSLFQFFTNKQRKPLTQQVHEKPILQNFGGGRGPIEEAFGSPVLVVEGSTGNQAQRTAVHDLAEEMRAE